MEQLDYNMLFRWFVGLAMDAPVWDVTVFTKNRERLLEGDIAAQVPGAVLSPGGQAAASDEHFSVDGTLIEAWASMKSFRPKDGSDEPPEPGRNGARDFHGEKRSNETHASTTDPDARLFRKGRGQAAKLCHMGHLLMENRHGLVVDTRLTQPPAPPSARRAGDGGAVPACTGSRSAPTRPSTQPGFVAELRAMNVTPHVAQNMTNRRSAIDGRTTRHPGYAVSQRIRKRIEEAFGWIKRSAACARPAIVGSSVSDGCSPSPRPPTIWSGSPSCWGRA